MTDTAKIEIGDKITVTGEVVDKSDKNDYFRVCLPGGSQVSLRASLLKEYIHTPKPWIPEIGEIVKISHGYWTGYRSTVLGISTEQKSVWVFLLVEGKSYNQVLPVVSVEKTMQ